MIGAKRAGVLPGGLPLPGARPPPGGGPDPPAVREPGHQGYRQGAPGIPPEGGLSPARLGRPSGFRPPGHAAHSADVFVIAVWFMLREIEVAAARVGDLAGQGRAGQGRAALPCPALPCPALPCPALPCPALPYTRLCLGAAGVLARAGEESVSTRWD